MQDTFARATHSAAKPSARATIGYLVYKNITNTTKCPVCDYETETVTHFIGQCPAYSQIRADYFQTYHSNTDDMFDKQSLTRIVGYALETKGFLTPDEKDQSGVK